MLVFGEQYATESLLWIKPK